MKATTQDIHNEEMDQLIRKCLKDEDVSSLDAFYSSIQAFNLLLAFIAQKNDLDEFFLFAKKINDAPKYHFSCTYRLVCNIQKAVLNSNKSKIVETKEFYNE